MQKATMTTVLCAFLRGGVFGVVMVTALYQMLTAWQGGALWHGLAALAVGVVYVLFELRRLRMPGRRAPDNEPADPV